MPTATKTHGKDAGRRKPRPKIPAVRLTDRERAILRGILRDLTYVKIAFDIRVGYETVKTGVTRLRAKLGVDSKVGLALWAKEHPREL